VCASISEEIMPEDKPNDLLVVILNKVDAKITIVQDDLQDLKRRLSVIEEVALNVNRRFDRLEERTLQIERRLEKFERR
jgi:septation ring formation regulator EzrA